MRSKKIFSIINLIILAALLCFIWGNSLQSRTASSEESRSVLEFLTALLVRLTGQSNLTQHIVRKLAHFCEFAALGFFTILFCTILKPKITHCISLTILFGFLCAAIDETLQLFNDRSAQLSDVLLDCTGVLAGMAFFVIVTGILRFFLVQKRRKH